ncbi:MAG TPA: secretin N-terminal domain-containing protein [Gemmatimonadaceae bacterium]|nr:secretin N-terminal domain-containing protein [Gemmatimonadaceae bacterium]
MAIRRLLGWVVVLVGTPAIALAQGTGSAAASRDSIGIHLVDVDLRVAIQALATHLDRPVVFGSVPDVKVTVETPQPVPQATVATLLRNVLESQNLELVADSGLYRVRTKQDTTATVSPQARDREPAGRGDAPQLFVIRLHHARAADVAATVNALYGQGTALGEPGAPPSTLSDQLRQNLVPPMGASQQVVPEVAGRVARLSGETTVIPDAGTNSLLVRANRSDFELIDAAVKELDVRPLQVLVEVLIAEVRKDRALSYGLGAELPAAGVGKGNTAVEGGTTGLGLGEFVLHVMKLGGVEAEATLAAAASRGDATILSRPVVIAANNEAASILVGSQRPFVQISRSLPTDNAVRDQVVQYRDVGTRLTVRPTISADGYVMLEVTQEVNAATAETQFGAPIISTRSVQTQLLIRDGQTVALGGLTDRQHEVTQGGVPLLSSIPILGGLFGHANRQTTATELFLFITPHVIRTDAEADSLTAPLKRKAQPIDP